MPGVKGRIALWRRDDRPGKLFLQSSVVFHGLAAIFYGSATSVRRKGAFV